MNHISEAPRHSGAEEPLMCESVTSEALDFFWTISALSIAVAGLFQVKGPSGFVDVITAFALGKIGEAGDTGISQTSLANSLQRSPTTITRLVDFLEEKDLVVRKRDEVDRRIKTLSLTRAGTELLERIREQASAAARLTFVSESLPSLQERHAYLKATLDIVTRAGDAAPKSVDP